MENENNKQHEKAYRLLVSAQYKVGNILRDLNIVIKNLNSVSELSIKDDDSVTQSVVDEVENFCEDYAAEIQLPRNILKDLLKKIQKLNDTYNEILIRKGISVTVTEGHVERFVSPKSTKDLELKELFNQFGQYLDDFKTKSLNIKKYHDLK